MRILSCIAASFMFAAISTPAVANAPTTASPSASVGIIGKSLELVANPSACKRACKSRYVCAGAYSTLKQACIDDRKACMKACK